MSSLDIVRFLDPWNSLLHLALLILEILYSTGSPTWLSAKYIKVENFTLPMPRGFRFHGYEVGAGDRHLHVYKTSWVTLMQAALMENHCPRLL